jgi:hypothetical protein
MSEDSRNHKGFFDSHVYFLKFRSCGSIYPTYLNDCFLINSFGNISSRLPSYRA